MKKQTNIGIILATLLMSAAICTEISANRAGRYITGFGSSGILVRIEIDESDRPAEQELVSCLPGTVEMLMGEENTPVGIPVSWYCVGDDYAKGDAYYYQFSPCWDEEKYPLADGLNVVRDAPYAAIFVV